MEDLIKEAAANEEFLDDCTAMVECIRCLRDKGVEEIDETGVSLKSEVFDRCFPGVEWNEVRDRQGRFVGFYEKNAVYRGFEFGALRAAGEGEE